MLQKVQQPVNAVYLLLLLSKLRRHILLHIEEDNEWERTRNGSGMQAT